MQALVVVMHRLRSCDLQALELRPSGCGTWASLLLGLRNLPRPEIESVSPALVGRFLSTVPSEKSWVVFLSTFTDEETEIGICTNLGSTSHLILLWPYSALSAAFVV